MELRLFEAKAEFAKKVAMFVIAGLLCFLVSPFVLGAIKGALGLITMWVIGVLFVNLAPVFGTLVAQLRLKALKWGFARHPIETLELDWKYCDDALNVVKEEIRVSAAAAEEFGNQLPAFCRQLPQSAAKYKEDYRKMRELVVTRVERYKRAKIAQAERWKFIELQRIEWNMAMSQRKASKAVGVLDGDSFNRRLAVSTALGAIQQAVNESFADLELSLADEQVAATIAAADKEAPGLAGAVQTATKQLPAAPSLADSINDLGIELDGDNVKVLK